MIINPYRFVTGGGGGGTDWTADATMKALYLFNSSPGINRDSKSTNHIDDATTIDAPAASSGDKIEGDQCADFETASNDDGFKLLMSNATADFPSNGTGDGEITLGCWVKAESIAATMYIACWADANGHYLRVNSSGNLIIRMNGTAAVVLTTTATITAGTWYFVALVYSDSANSIRCYIRAQGAGSSTWETTDGTSVGTLDDFSANSFFVGCFADAASGGCWDGLIDAMAVFNGKAMSQAELDGVFVNGWDGNGW